MYEISRKAFVVRAAFATPFKKDPPVLKPVGKQHGEWSILIFEFFYLCVSSEKLPSPLAFLVYTVYNKV